MVLTVVCQKKDIKAQICKMMSMTNNVEIEIRNSHLLFRRPKLTWVDYSWYVVRSSMCRHLFWKIWKTQIDFLCWLHSYILHSDYIQATFWLLFFATFWLHSDYILTTFLLHSGFILATFWLHSTYILLIFWLHFAYILPIFWLHSD